MAAVYVFIFVTSLILMVLVTIFAGSIAFSLSFYDYPLSEESRGVLGCYIDVVNSCSDCDNPNEALRCLEWNKEDVTRVIQTQVKNSAAMAFVFALYSIAAIRFGFTMRKYIILYQIDFV